MDTTTPQAGADPTVVLTADAGPFEKSMDRAAAAMDAWASRVESRLQQTAKKTEEKTASMAKQLKDGFQQTFNKMDDIAGLVGVGLKGAFVAVAAKGAEMLRDWASGVKDLEKELDKLPRQFQKIADDMARVSALRKEWIDVAGGPAATVHSIDAELDRLNEEMRLAESKKSIFESADKRHNIGVKTGWENSTTAAGLWVSGKFEATQKIIDAHLAEAEGRADKLAVQMDDLNERRMRLIDPEQDPAMKGSIDAVSAALKKQGDMWGETADKITLYDLRLKGATEQQLKNIEAEMRDKDRLIAAKVGMAFAGTFGLQQGPDAPKADWNKGASALIGGSQGAQAAIIAAQRSTMAANMDPQARVAKGVDDLNRNLVELRKESAADTKAVAAAVERLREAIETPDT